MADGDLKASELQTISSFDGNELVYLVVDPNGTPTSRNTDINSLFGNVSANAVFTGTVTLDTATVQGVVDAQANVAVTGLLTLNQSRLKITDARTPSTSNTNTEFGELDGQGSIFYDDDFLYVSTSNNQIKRIPLQSF